MAKKHLKNNDEEENLHIEVESWQWESNSNSKKITWKQWLAIGILLGVALLFAFGFLIIALVILSVGIILNLVYFIFKKFS